MNSDTHQIVTTNLVHRRDKTAAPWWRSAVVCDLPGSFSAKDMTAITEYLPDIAGLGFTGILVRPASTQSEKSLKTLEDLIAAAHASGLQVLVRVFIPEDDEELEPVESPPLLQLEHDASQLQEQVQTLLEMGADGVDLGKLEEDLGGSDASAKARAFTETVQELLADVTLAGDSTVLSAAVSTQPRDAAQRHLTEEWFHHLRDDSLIVSPWDADELSRQIVNTYSDRDPLGQSAAWRYSMPRWSPSPLARDSESVGWAAHPDGDDREMAMMLLVLALPGAAYVPFLHVGGGVKAGKRKSGPLKFSFAKGRGAQFRSRIARDAISLRHRLDLGETALASVEGLDWANVNTAVMLAGPVMVVLNTGTDTVTVPPEHRLALSSEPYPRVTDDGSLVPPNTCAWFHTAARRPEGPVAYR